MNTHNKKGIPTAYGFSCGYVQKETSGIMTKEMYKEGGVYHIVMTIGKKVLNRFSYDKLTWARDFFKNLPI